LGETLLSLIKPVAFWVPWSHRIHLFPLLPHTLRDCPEQSTIVFRKLVTLSVLPMLPVWT
jgi:hypothetical protein